MISLMPNAISATCLSPSLETPLFNNNKSKPSPLPSNFQPRDIDVMCGRGKGFWNHTGNKRFKKAIQFSLDRYAKASTKTGKSAVVSSLVETLRKTGTLFIKYDKKSKCWYDIGDRLAREKTSHAIRDHVSAGGGVISNKVIQQNQKHSENVMPICVKEQTENNVITALTQSDLAMESGSDAMDSSIDSSSTHSTTSDVTEASNIMDDSVQQFRYEKPSTNTVSSNDSVCKRSSFAFEDFVINQSSLMSSDALEDLFCKMNGSGNCHTDSATLEGLSCKQNNNLELCCKQNSRLSFSLSADAFDEFFCNRQNECEQPQHERTEIEDEIIPWSELFPVDWDNC